MKVLAICPLILIVGFLGEAAPNLAGEIAFEPGIEYANPDDQHLQLNLARPKEGIGPFPQSSASTEAGSAPANAKVGTSDASSSPSAATSRRRSPTVWRPSISFWRRFTTAKRLSVGCGRMRRSIASIPRGSASWGTPPAGT